MKEMDYRIRTKQPKQIDESTEQRKFDCPGAMSGKSRKEKEMSLGWLQKYLASKTNARFVKKDGEAKGKWLNIDRIN